ncbi:MAG: ThiF family adenylyltransferase [Candidatus Thiodiazotropha endolucinida]
MSAFFLNPHWEVLWTENGDVIFNATHGAHIRLRGPSDDVRNFIASLDSQRLESDLPPQPVEPNSDRQKWFAEELVRAQVLVPASDTPMRLESLEQQQWARFKSFYAYLGGLEGTAFGVESFSRLRNARVAVIGLGGVGSLCAMMLAACNVGELHLVDADTVSSSNLVRQLFYTESDAECSTKKVSALKSRILSLNSAVRVRVSDSFVTSLRDAKSIADQSDLVLLTADRPRILIQRLVSRACLDARTAMLNCFLDRVGPLQIAGQSPCFECVEKIWRGENGTDHDEIVRSLQRNSAVEYPSSILGMARTADALATEAVIYLCKWGRPRSISGMLRLDKVGVTLDQMERDPKCPACGAI